MTALAKIPLFNIAVMLGGMQVAKRLKWEDRRVLNRCRAMFLSSKLLIILILLYVRRSIQVQNDSTTLVIEKHSSDATDDTEVSTTTVRAYDLAELKKLVRSQAIGLVLISVVHFYFRLNPPLIAQSILPVKTVIQSPLVQVHLRGKPAVGDLKRPFNEDPGPVVKVLGRLKSIVVGGKSSSKKTAKE